MTIKDLWASCSQWNHYFDRLFEKNVKYWKKCKINLFLTIDPNREMNSKIFSAFCILLLLQAIALTVPGEKNMISDGCQIVCWCLLRYMMSFCVQIDLLYHMMVVESHTLNLHCTRKQPCNRKLTCLVIQLEKLYMYLHRIIHVSTQN